MKVSRRDGTEISQASSLAGAVVPARRSTVLVAELVLDSSFVCKTCASCIQGNGRRLPVGCEGIEAIEASLLPVSAPGPCTRATAGRRPLYDATYGMQVRLSVFSVCMHGEQLGLYGEQLRLLANRRPARPHTRARCVTSAQWPLRPCDGLHSRKAALLGRRGR